MKCDNCVWQRHSRIRCIRCQQHGWSEYEVKPEEDTPPGWLTGILSKRSTTAIRILLELIEVGLAKGEVSANDVTVEVSKEQANVIGAVFKILHRFGFVHTDRRVKVTARKKHGRRVDVWEMRTPQLAKSMMNHVKSILTVKGRAEVTQGSLL